MREIKWRGHNGPVCHCIYTVEEADIFGMQYEPIWRDGRLGDWVLTDDRHVVQILRQAEDSRGRYTLGTCTTTVACSSKRKLDVEQKEDRYQIGGKAKKTTLPKEMNAKMLHFCTLLLSGMESEDAYVKAYNSTADPSYIRRRAKKIMALPVVQQHFKNELGDAMQKEGITIPWVLERYRKIIIEGDKDAPKVVALNKLCGFLGMDDMTKVKDEELPPLPEGVLSSFSEIKEEEPSVELPKEANANFDEIEEENETTIADLN